MAGPTKIIRDDDDDTVSEVDNGEDLPVFDRADELPLPMDQELPVDDENNVLPGNDDLDEDPNDNGEDEQFDPEQTRARLEIGQPLEP